MIELATIPPVIVALVEIAKRAGLNSHYAPLLSIALGITMFLIWGSLLWQENLFLGLIAGLTASGAYSGIKKQVE